MAYHFRRADYFYVTVEDEPGEAYELLSQLASLGVNLLAMMAVPVGPLRTQLTLFPEDPARMVESARRAGLTLDGPYPALLVQGDDELGALVGVHNRLHRAHVNVYASTAVTDGKGAYGYILYVRPDEYDRAMKALQA
jgi:hypothetical protein